MSNSLHAVSSKTDCENLSTCPQKCRWLEISILVSGCALLILSGFAFSQTGAFAHVGFALPFGISCLTVSTTLFLFDLVYRTIKQCKKRIEKTEVLPEINPFQPNKNFESTSSHSEELRQQVSSFSIESELKSANDEREVSDLEAETKNLGFEFSFSDLSHCAQELSQLSIDMEPENAQSASEFWEEKSETQASEEDIFQHIILPEIPLRDRLGPAHGESTLPSSTFYSNKRPAKQKMAIGLDYAIRQGNLNSKVFESNFSLNLDNETSVKPRSNLSDFVGIATEANFRFNDFMEDVYMCKALELFDEKYHLIGIFDGHGDQGILGNFFKENLIELLKTELEGKENLDDQCIADAFTNILVTSDVMFRNEGGTCVCCIFMEKDKIYTVNVGDCRALLIRKGNFIQLSEDAHPTHERFNRAVKKLGYPVIGDRVASVLNVARDVGLEMVPARPKITCIFRNIEDDFENMHVSYEAGNYLVLASDGLWDVATNREIFDAIHVMDRRGMDVSSMACYLIDAAKRAGSKDNISAMVVKI